MQKIPLNLAREGMKLAKPVTRENGMVLVAEGTEITETILMRLANMKIQNVVVDGTPVDMDGLGSGTDYAKMLERLPHLFRKHGEDAWMLKIRARLEGYFKVKAAAAGAAAAEAEEAASDAGASEGGGHA